MNRLDAIRARDIATEINGSLHLVAVEQLMQMAEDRRHLFFFEIADH